MVAAGRSTSCGLLVWGWISVSADRGRGRSVNRSTSSLLPRAPLVSADRGRGRSVNGPPRKSLFAMHVRTFLRACLEFRSLLNQETAYLALQTLHLHDVRALPAPWQGTVTLAAPGEVRDLSIYQRSRPNGRREYEQPYGA